MKTKALSLVFMKLKTGIQTFFRFSLKKVILYSISTLCIISSSVNAAPPGSPVDRYGQIRVSGNRIVDQYGNAVQLRGMSLYWSQWKPAFYNYNNIKWLYDDWKCTVVRAAMAVEAGGYLTNPTEEKTKIKAVVEAAISLGIYVIIDWHDHNANEHTNEAVAFFREMAQTYGSYPNVIYETFNEPTTQSWANVIKPYHQTVVNEIRKYDPDNIILCGTRQWSQLVDEAAANPVSGSNIAYVCHFYAGSHGQWLRDEVSSALARNKAVFISEYGTCSADGNGAINESETRAWWSFCDNNKISHCNWSVADLSETSAALYPGASSTGGWPSSQIKPSGNLVRNELRAKYDGGNCNPTSITPYIQVGGTWQQASSATVDSGAEVAFGPQPVSGGSWSWSGCGTSGSSREQTIYPTSSCTATATYTNSCGAQSTQNFTITVNGGGGQYVQLQNRATGLFLDGMGRTVSGDACGQWANTSSLNAQWEIIDAGSGYSQLRNRATGLFLDGMGRTANGDDVGQWANTTSHNSHWSIQQYSGSYYRIQNRATGLYIDGLGRTSHGNAAGQWANTTSQNAQWQLIAVGSGSRVAAETTERANRQLDVKILSPSETAFIYPNPLNEVLNIRLKDNDGSAVAKIFNVSGQMVLSKQLTALNNEIEVGNLKNGVYLVEVTTASGTCRSKLIKQ